MQSEVTILLTGSIAPAVDFVAISNPLERRAQYLTALRFYRDFAPVIFLENSSYDLTTDKDFADLEGVQIRKFSMLPEGARGKGYQEFAMIDAWYDQEAAPPSRFLKITGRYLLPNVADLLAECRHASGSTVLIDRIPRRKIALTSIFSTNWLNYGHFFRGLYRNMNDSTGAWAEHAFYDALVNQLAIKCFANEPDIHGISGSTGEALESPRWKWVAKQILRTTTRVITADNLYLRN